MATYNYLDSTGLTFIFGKIKSMIPLAGTSALTGSIVPSSTSTANLGSGNSPFSTGYFHNVHSTNGFMAVTDSSSTQYTIYERTRIVYHQSSSASSVYTLTLPEKTGTIALTSDITALGNVLEYKGTLTVADINALNTSSIGVGDTYNLSDAGTLTQGSVSVLAGDNVAWTGSEWDKLGSTADLSNYVTSTDLNSALGNYVPLAGTSALTGSIVPSSTSTANLGSGSSPFSTGYFGSLQVKDTLGMIIKGNLSSSNVQKYTQYKNGSITYQYDSTAGHSVSLSFGTTEGTLLVDNDFATWQEGDASTAGTLAYIYANA